MLKRKFMVDVSTGFDELLQHNVGINDVKSYIRQKLNEDSFLDELGENFKSNSRKKNKLIGRRLSSEINVDILSEGSDEEE